MFNFFNLLISMHAHLNNVFCKNNCFRIEYYIFNNYHV